MFTKIAETIKKYDTIILHRHTNPDGDALGSQIGLKAVLQENLCGGGRRQTVFLYGRLGNGRNRGRNV